MPRVDTVVSCDVRRSFRVSQVEGMFDLPEREAASERFAAELPEAVMPGTSEPWQIGLVVGPSGSGKTTIARAAFGRLDGTRRWPRDRAVVDCFGRRSIKEITAMLTAVGFSSPPAWVKPYRVLSQGEQFRCDLARALLTRRRRIVFDEFTSVVDRTVARIGSAAVAKTVRRIPGKQFVAVTCHYDVAEWLEPDWVLDMGGAQEWESERVSEGRFHSSPPLPLSASPPPLRASTGCVFGGRRSNCDSIARPPTLGPCLRVITI